MRTQTVVVTRRTSSQGPADPPFAAVRDEILGALASGASEIGLGGGEPLLRGDLLALVRVARANGSGPLVLETSGALLGATAARELKAAGIGSVRIPIATTRAALGLAQADPRLVFRGIAACIEADLRVIVRLPIGSELPAAAARIGALRHAFTKLDTFELAISDAHGAPSPEALAAELADAWHLARKLGVEIEIASDSPLAPCIVPLEGGARRLIARHLREEGDEPNRACAACDTCGLARRCAIRSGDLARLGGSDRARPIADIAEYTRPGKSAGSRLRVLGAAEVETFFHVDYDYGVDVETPTSRIGIIYRCNQVCTFCELADMDTDLSVAKVRAAIDASLARGSKRLIVTGGEPTLSSDLVSHVRYARDQGYASIELQTNAVLLDRPGFAAELRAAGLTSAQVSLHGPDSEVSDRLTAAPGTHRRTLAGVANLLEAGVDVLLNHLIFKDNCHLLEAFVEMVDARFGAHRERITIQFHSARNEFTTREEGLAHIARYTEYAATLRRAIDRARSLGFRTQDQGDPTGIPSLCVLDADASYLGPIVDQATRPRFHAWESDWVTRVDACKTCDAASACMGVPRHYLALHGDAEFRPIVRDVITSSDAQAG